MDAGRLRQREVIRAGTAAVVGLACVCALANRPAAAETSFDYLYIEASSGSSAGGHAAVRFGDDVYHFQYDRPGIIRAATEPWSSFDLSYRGLENRPIHVQRIAVSSEAYERLRIGFHRRYVVQETQVRLLDDLRQERSFLQCLEQQRGDSRPCKIRFRGAGYFYASPDDRLDPVARPHSPVPSVLEAGSAALEAARHDVGRSYGDDYVDRRVEELRSQIEKLHPAETVVELPREGVIVTSPSLLSDRYRNLLLELLALKVLAGRAAAQPTAFRVLPGPLTGAQRASLEQREAHELRSIAFLVGSKRPDRGYPLLIALARLVALRASVEGGQLIVLDTYADDVPTTSLASLRGLPALAQVRAERWQEMLVALNDAVATTDNEAAWSTFEVAANVALELKEGADGTLPWRSHQSSLVPARGAQLQADWPVPQVPAATLAFAIDQVTREIERVERRLRALYRYDLLSRNCVTEIFRTIDDENGREANFAARVDPSADFHFIPFMSATAVRNSYPVEEHFVLPSYREQQLERLQASPHRWDALLREETSLTATIVPVHTEEDAFLFFSNGTALLRPLKGAANVAFGAGALLAGLLSAPFDRGELLIAGANGVLYSLPEFAFVNIRKGTVAVLPSTWDTSSECSP